MGMQNVVNYLCPFFRNGSPIVNGRVYFVKPSTSALTFSDIEGLDGGDYIAIKDKDGTLLENPLSLNSEGRFSVQPFVDDGVDFKMIVCYPTGQPAEINDESMTYDVAYTINSFSQESEILSIGGVAAVDSVAALRNLEPTVKAALVRGYGAAGDFCPPRLFSWVTTAYTDDNGTKIRSSVSGYTTNGTWVCTPSGLVDIRWFGVDPGSSEDFTSVIIAVAQGYPGIPLYFPAGSYYISSHVTAKSVIFERLAIVYPTDDTTNDLRFTVENSFENRGGRFEKNGLDCCVYPKVRGVLRTSWLSSPMDAALASANLANVDEIIFDATKNVSVATTIAKKRVLVKDGMTVDNAITFAPTCSVYYETNGKHAVGSLKVGADWKVEPDDSATPPELKISKGSTVIAKIKETLTEFLVKVKMALGFNIDSSNAWQKYENALSDWNDLIVLVAERIFATNARLSNANAETLIAESLAMTNGAIKRYLRYSDDCFAQVGNGAITLWGDYPATQQSYSDNKINLKTVYEYFDNVPGDGYPCIIGVLIDERAEAVKRFLLPNTDLDGCAFEIINPLKNEISLFEVDANDSSVIIGAVKVMGIYTAIPSFSGSNIPTRVYVRNPTTTERTRFNIPSTVHWIVDPFAL